MPDGASRLVSLHDSDARPIRKGRIGRPVEFGYKAQVVDNPDGVVLDHQIMVSNPPDAPLLAPAVERVIARIGKVPRAVTADRGYGEGGIQGARNWCGYGVCPGSSADVVSGTGSYVGSRASRDHSRAPPPSEGLRRSLSR
jgi:transposase, IS5 family